MDMEIEDDGDRNRRRRSLDRRPSISDAGLWIAAMSAQPELRQTSQILQRAQRPCPRLRLRFERNPSSSPPRKIVVSVADVANPGRDLRPSRCGDGVD